MKKRSIIFPLILFTQAALAGDCVIVVFGGAKEWLSLLPGIPTDISIDVDSAVKTQASKTGCRMLSMANDTEKDFYENLKKLKSAPYNKPGTNYHLAFADHGAPPGKNINDSVIVTGKKQYTTYGKFMNELKTLLPKGSHVTFQTNSCWPNFSEALIANKMEDNFSICGSSSTAAEQMSWNLHDVIKRDDGKTIGPYGAVGLAYANEYKKSKSVFPSVSDFHYQAKKGDMGNLKKQPGTTTSLAFAKTKLREAKIKIPLENADILDTFTNIFWKNNEALEKYIHGNPAQQAQDVDMLLTGTCKPMEKNPFNDFLSRFSPVYQSLVGQNMDGLPSPYAERTKNARDFLLRNQKRFAALLSTIARERAAFIKKNQNHPREKYAEVEKEWQSLLNRQGEQLSEYLFQFRLLQEGKTVQSFVTQAKPEDKKRFEMFLNCEKSPML